MLGFFFGYGYHTPSGVQVLPIVLQVAFVGGLFTVLATILSRSVAAQQVNVSRQTLFVALLGKRSDWREANGKAVRDRSEEIKNYDPSENWSAAREILKKTKDTTPLEQLQDLRLEAAYLFGPEVLEQHDKVTNALTKLQYVKNKERQGLPFAPENVDHTDFYEAQAEVSVELRRLNGLLVPYLSVGDIKTNPPPLKWSDWFWVSKLPEVKPIVAESKTEKGHEE
jgi:hypothetical protein